MWLQGQHTPTVLPATVDDLLEPKEVVSKITKNLQTSQDYILRPVRLSDVVLVCHSGGYDNGADDR